MNSPFITEDDHGMSRSTFLNGPKTIGEIRRWIVDMAGDQPCTGYIELYPYPQKACFWEKQPDGDRWFANCGHAYDGRAPGLEDGILFCPFCGKKINTGHLAKEED